MRGITSKEYFGRGGGDYVGPGAVLSPKYSRGVPAAQHRYVDDSEYIAAGGTLVKDNEFFKMWQTQVGQYDIVNEDGVVISHVQGGFDSASDAFDRITHRTIMNIANGYDD